MDVQIEMQEMGVNRPNDPNTPRVIRPDIVPLETAPDVIPHERIRRYWYQTSCCIVIIVIIVIILLFLFWLWTNRVLLKLDASATIDTVSNRTISDKHGEGGIHF
ncbi:hypothetical protein HNY73_002066 [Argiope bruennichi]|uniref:Uncharacterized protein n=1 Tax=Argiope bruennichi TaxID=94029 RepID=A0A8T0FYV2_ARGBR|nr:hypothetical protein HNY73_002066 [Argiope bruennichi]